jgi:hypothetical protein
MRKHKNARLMNVHDFNFLTISSQAFKVIKDLPQEPQNHERIELDDSFQTFSNGTGKFNSDGEEINQEEEKEEEKIG